MLNKHNPELLHTFKQEELLPSISLWTRLGGLFLIGTCGAAVILAALTKYPVKVKVSAIVRPTGELRIVQAAFEGIVKDILVKENQIVTKKTTIALIDSSELKTRKNQIERNINFLDQQITLLNAQMKTLQAQITAESSSMQRAILSASSELRRNQREYRDRQIITQAEVDEAQASLDLAQEEMRRYQQLGNTGAITQIQIKEKEQAFKAAVSKLQRAKAGLNPSAAAVDIARNAIAQGKSTGESTLAALKRERESLLQRRIEIRSSINTAQKDLKQVETELQKTVIRATEAGTILKLELRNPGQVVRAGDTIAQIASAQAPLVVKAQIPSQDIGKVLVCKAKKVSDCEQGKAVLRVSAYPYPDYGTLRGAVRAITADAIKPEKSSAPYYEVSIEPEKLTLEKGGISYRIQPGMEVTADIISREETVLTFVLRKARLLTNL